VYSKSNSDIKYEGQYKNGMKHGIGKLYFDRGKILSGTWNKGKKEG
jgi:antitoxin component YwqK of YwqJK toxin-antitoxin module